MKRKRKLIYAGAVLAFIAVWFFVGKKIGVDVSDVGKPQHKIKEVFGITIPFNGVNASTILNTWVVMSILIILAVFTRKRLTSLPGMFQVVMESFVDSFDSLCRDTLGREQGRKYVPFVATVFIFVLVSNVITIVPLPWLKEPTRDLNTTLGLSVLCFFVAHVSGIRQKGWKGYLKEYIDPGGVIGYMMLPLNIVGEITKVVSHSFRLFGNIMGGAILTLVLLTLSKQFIGVYLVFQPFFGIFVGLVQAFVFAMLALAYIAVKVT